MQGVPPWGPRLVETAGSAKKETDQKSDSDPLFALYVSLLVLGGSRRWQEALDFLDDARDLILIGKSDHEKLVAFVETNHAVGKQPNAT